MKTADEEYMRRVSKAVFAALHEVSALPGMPSDKMMLYRPRLIVDVFVMIIANLVAAGASFGSVTKLALAAMGFNAS